MFQKVRRSPGCKVLTLLCFATFITVTSVYNFSSRIQTGHVFRHASCENEDTRTGTHETLNQGIVQRSQVVCETSYIGCYKILTKIHTTVLKASYHYMTPNWCISYCQSNLFNFAALNGSGNCLCSGQFEYVADIRDSADNCDIVCGGADVDDGDQMTCGGDNSIEAYFIKGECVKEPFHTEYVDTRHRGCVKTPKTDLARNYVTLSSSQQCLMFCEEARKPLAIYGKDGKCWCGKADKSFSLTPKSDFCNSIDTVEVFRTLVEDKRCGNIRLLPPGKYKTLLASYPGSGNTWTRYLLEKATGYYTGSVFNDGSLKKIGYLGEIITMKENRTDIIKDHLFGKRKGAEFKTIILIVRNPYKSLVSFYNFMKSTKDRHTNSASEEILKQEVNKSMLNHVGNWKRINEKVVAQKKPLLVMFYEDIVADPISSVREMVEFLPNPALHPSDLDDRLACLSQETTGLAKRKTSKLPPDLFSAEVRKAVDNAVADLREIMRKAGVSKKLPPYEKGPDFDW